MNFLPHTKRLKIQSFNHSSEEEESGREAAEGGGGVFS